MTGIVERLRSRYVMFARKPHFSDKLPAPKAADLDEAADEIERLRVALSQARREAIQELEAAAHDVNAFANVLPASEPAALFRARDTAYRLKKAASSLAAREPEPDKGQ